jgi:hypothetical protein
MVERYRSRSNVVTLPSFFVPSVGATVGGYRNFNLNEEMWDTVTPGYFRMVREGNVLPVNSMTQKSKTLDTADVLNLQVRSKKKGTCTSTGYSVLGEYSGCLAYDSSRNYISDSNLWPSYPSVPGDVASVNQLVPEALAEARLKDMDVLTTVAEIRKSAALLVGVRDRVVQRAERITAKLRRKGKLDAVISRTATHGAMMHRLRTVQNRRVLDSFLDAFYDSWMEDRYGWRILVYDLEDAWETWLKFRHGVSDVVKGKASDESETITSSSLKFSGTLAYPGGSQTFPYSELLIERGLRTTRTVGLGYRYALNTRLTADPVITALELAKFSFVADWFTNLGDIVRAYSPFGMGNVLWVYSTLEYENFARITCMNPRSGLITWTSYCCPPTTSVWYSSARVKTRSMVSWNDHVPEVRFFNDLDIPKVIDAMALLRGLGKPLGAWLRA